MLKAAKDHGSQDVHIEVRLIRVIRHGAGLKGATVGGAEVSRKHANFIVAHPGATAADVSALIDRIRARVADRSGVTLVPEVRRIGAVDGA